VRRSVVLGVLAAALVALLTSVAPGWAGESAAAPTAATESITVDVGTPTRVVPRNFIGLGLEYRTVPAFAGDDPNHIDPVFLQLVRNLDPGQQTLIRLGGQSTDRVWVPIRGVKQSPGITYDLTARWIATARAMIRALNARLVVGINLEANSTRIAGAEARSLVNAFGRSHVQALEIGNEPDLYTVTPWYRVENGHPIPWYEKTGSPVLARSPGYNLGGFTGDFSRFAKAMPGLPLAGPATGNVRWLSGLSRFIGAEPRLHDVTFHRYGLNNCVHDPGSPDYPSVANLLAPHASRGIMDGVGPFISLSHRHHLGFLIDEMGSITCNGTAGVSDTFASALWAVDSMFAMVSGGVDAVNLHSFQNSLNGLFDFRLAHGHWEGRVHPMYYGMLMFAQAAPPGSRLLHVAGPADSDLRTWATVAHDGTIRTLMINDSQSSGRNVSVRGIPSGTATLERLEAPSAHAKIGVSIGGRHFAKDTRSGTLVGRPKLSRLAPSGNAYSVWLPPASAAMLTIAHR
jgi:hypothetical protein